MIDGADDSHGTPDDRIVLMARVDELMAVVAAVSRASSRARQRPPTSRPDQLTEDELIALWSGLVDDIDYLRALAVALRAEADGLADELDAAQAAQQAAEARAQGWQEEADRLRAHRNEVAGQLLAVQGSRWMSLGRQLRIVRGHEPELPPVEPSSG